MWACEVQVASSDNPPPGSRETLAICRRNANPRGTVTRYTSPPTDREAFMRALISLVLLTLGCSSAFAQRGPADVVQGFYTARLASPGSGAPSGRELAEFSGYLGPELVCLLGAALRYNDKFSQARPDDKPPFVEGDLYSSSFETPTRFSLGKVQQTKTSASVPVHFYVDSADKPDSKGWEDVVHLNIVRTRWMITDVEYKGGFAFGNKGELFESLRAGLENAEPVTGWSVRELDSCTMDKVAPKKAKGKAKAKSKPTSKAKSSGKKSQRR